MRASCVGGLSCGGGSGQVVSAQVYLADLGQLEYLDTAWREWFGNKQLDLVRQWGSVVR